MIKKKRKRLLLWIIIPASLIVFGVFAPHFLFRQTRIIHELDWLSTSLINVRVVDYQGCWFRIYAKLELSNEEYDSVKQSILQTGAAASNIVYSMDILNEQQGHIYNLDFTEKTLQDTKYA
jgi:hypothetical protein